MKKQPKRNDTSTIETNKNNKNTFSNTKMISSKRIILH